MFHGYYFEQNEYPQSQCLCVSVNDIEDGYDYPEVVRFEIEEQDLPSYLRAADFLNISDVGLELYVPETGGCRDGLHVDRVNGNQGAESTLAFLLSLVEMRQAQNMLTSFRQPITAEDYPPLPISLR